MIRTLSSSGIPGGILEIAVDALGRRQLRVTPPDVFHLAEMCLMPLTVFMALAATQRLRGHVNVTLLSGLIGRPSLLEGSRLSVRVFRFRRPAAMA